MEMCLNNDYVKLLDSHLTYLKSSTESINTTSGIIGRIIQFIKNIINWVKNTFNIIVNKIKRLWSNDKHLTNKNESHLKFTKKKFEDLKDDVKSRIIDKLLNTKITTFNKNDFETIINNFYSCCEIFSNKVINTIKEEINNIGNKDAIYDSFSIFIQELNQCGLIISSDNNQKIKFSMDSYDKIVHNATFKQLGYTDITEVFDIIKMFIENQPKYDKIFEFNNIKQSLINQLNTTIDTLKQTASTDEVAKQDIKATSENVSDIIVLIESIITTLQNTNNVLNLQCLNLSRLTQAIIQSTSATESYMDTTVVVTTHNDKIDVLKQLTSKIISTIDDPTFKSVYEIELDPKFEVPINDLDYQNFINGNSLVFILPRRINNTISDKNRRDMLAVLNKLLEKYNYAIDINQDNFFYIFVPFVTSMYYMPIHTWKKIRMDYKNNNLLFDRLIA